QRFTVQAKFDAYLDIKGVQRVSVASDYSVTIDGVSTGGNANLLLQPAQRETPSGSTTGVSIEYTGHTDGETHFTHFTTPDPAATATVTTGTNPTNIVSTYDLRAFNTATGLRTLPGVVAGGNISVASALPNAAAPQLINVLGNVLITGYVDILTNGMITINEHTGNLRVGSISSTANDVLLYASATIVDELNDAAADVSGRNITLVGGSGLVLNGTITNPLPSDIDAPVGGIGTSTNFLEINVDVLNGVT